MLNTSIYFKVGTYFDNFVLQSEAVECVDGLFGVICFDIFHETVAKALS